MEYMAGTLYVYRNHASIEMSSTRFCCCTPGGKSPLPTKEVTRCTPIRPGCASIDTGPGIATGFRKYEII